MWCRRWWTRRSKVTPNSLGSVNYATIGKTTNCKHAWSTRPLRMSIPPLFPLPLLIDCTNLEQCRWAPSSLKRTHLSLDDVFIISVTVTSTWGIPLVWSSPHWRTDATARCLERFTCIWVALPKVPQAQGKRKLLRILPRPSPSSVSSLTVPTVLTTSLWANFSR